MNRMLLALMMFMALLSLQPAQAACSPWMDKAAINEYAFGGASQNYFETFSSEAAFPASWANWKLVIYRSGFTPVTYQYATSDANVAACTKNNKTWLRYLFPYNGALDGNSPAVVELWDANGDVVDAFAFDKRGGNSDAWTSNANNVTISGGNTGLAGRCNTLANRLSADVTANASNNEWSTTNMLVYSGSGNKAFSRSTDGRDGVWGNSTGTGSNTVISNCTSNNTALFKTTSSSTAPPGGSVTFTVSLKNTGTAGMSATVTDAAVATAPSGSAAIPPALVLSSATPSTGSGTATINNNAVTWTITTLPAGATASMTVVGTVPTNAEIGTVYKNTASTSSVTPTQIDSASVTVVSPSAESFLITSDRFSSCTAATATSTPAAPIITLTAMSELNGTGSRVTGFTGTVYLNTSTGNGTWSRVPGSANGTLSGDVYTFAASDNGQAQFYLVNANAESVGITATAVVGTAAMTGSSPADITYGSSTLSLANDDTIAPTAYGMIAGRPHRMKATMSSCAGALATTGNVSSKIWYTTSQYHPSSQAVYVTTDPTCSTGKVQLLSAAPVANNLALTFSQGATTSISNATFYVCTTDVGQYLLNMSTASSSAASQYQTARPFALTVSGIVSTNNQTKNPGGAAVSNSSADPVFAKAGNALTMNFDAWRWPSATSATSTLANADGTLNTSGSVNLATVSAGGRTPGFNASAVFRAAVNTPVGSTEGALGRTSLGSSSTIAIPLTAGTSTLTDLYYSEVGSFLLQGTGSISGTNTNNTAVADYLSSSGVSVPTLVFKNINGTETWNSASNVIGRFTPDHFKITGIATLTNRVASSCAPASDFSYMGEAFALGFELTARNSRGDTTKNYSTSSGFARLSGNSTSKWTTYNTADSLGFWGLATDFGDGNNCVAVFGSTAAGSPASYTTTVARARGKTTGTCSGTITSTQPRLTLATANPAPTASWTDGVGQFSAGVVFQRASSLDGPYDNVRLGIWPVDSDSVSFTMDSGAQATARDLDVNNTGSDMRATLYQDSTSTANPRTAAVRHGRLRLTNQYGSEFLPLYMPLTVQYYKSGTGSDGSKIGWTTSADDNCTANTVPTLIPASASARNKLGAGQVKAYLWNNPTSAYVAAGTGVINQGGGNAALKPLKLTSIISSAKGPGAIGYVDVSFPTTPDYLLYPWTSTRNYPEGRAIFGIPTSRTSFVREMY